MRGSGRGSGDSGSSLMIVVLRCHSISRLIVVVRIVIVRCYVTSTLIVVVRIVIVRCHITRRLRLVVICNHFSELGGLDQMMDLIY